MHNGPYPLEQRQVKLGSGRSVTVYNVVVFASEESSLGVQYSTSLSIDEREARIAEAAEVLDIYASLADAQQISRASAQICNTQAATETREAPEQAFTFERDGDGGWVYAGEAPRPSAGPPSN